MVKTRIRSLPRKTKKKTVRKRTQYGKYIPTKTRKRRPKTKKRSSSSDEGYIPSRAIERSTRRLVRPYFRKAAPGTKCAYTGLPAAFVVNGVPMSLWYMKKMGIEAAAGVLQTQFYSAVDPFEDGTGWYLTQAGDAALPERDPKYNLWTSLIKYYSDPTKAVVGEITRLPQALKEDTF